MQSERQLVFLRTCFTRADRLNKGGDRCQIRCNYMKAGLKHFRRCDGRRIFGGARSQVRRGGGAGHPAVQNFSPPQLLLSQMFKDCFDADGALRVTQSTFVRVMQSRTAKTDLLEDVRRLFKALDLRAEGFVSFRSFQQVCEMTIPHASHEMVTRVFQEADCDGDGRVTYQDFERLCLLAMQVKATDSKYM